MRVDIGFIDVRLRPQDIRFYFGGRGKDFFFQYSTRDVSGPSGGRWWSAIMLLLGSWAETRRRTYSFLLIFYLLEPIYMNT